MINYEIVVNMTIMQLINKDGVTFEIVNQKPSKELLEALQEDEVILQEMKEGKRKD